MPPPNDIYAVEALLKLCNAITSLGRARQLHALILTTATPFHARSPYIHNNVLSMYARSGSLADAQKTFDGMPRRSLVSFNGLIASYSRDPSHANLVLQLRSQMETEFISPNGSTFTSLVQAASLLENRLMGSWFHSQLIKYGFSDDICVQTSLLGMYSNCGDLESANKIFGCIGHKDDVAWNSIILGNLKNGRIQEGFSRFKAMVGSGATATQFTYSMILSACGRFGDYIFGKFTHAQVIVSNTQADLPLQNALLDMYCNCSDTQSAFRVFTRIAHPDLVSWNSMISGYMENGDGDRAMDTFIALKRISLPKPDEYTFAAIIHATSAFEPSNYGKLLHALVIKAGFGKTMFVGTTLVSMYFKNGDSISAQKIFMLVSEKDIVLWTEMIIGHSRMRDGENAIKLFRDMCRAGHKSDSFTLSGALNACADLATLRQGEMIHSLTVKTGYNQEMSVSGSLIDMYAKNGDLHLAQSIFSQVWNPDLKCWNAMLGGYSHHGMAEGAFVIFDAIIERGLGPDQVTFLSLLSACSHNGLVEKGKFLWNNMQDYSLVPGPKHYSCMVSLLSRAGFLDEAEKIILESPYVNDNIELWRTLLSCCIAKRDLDRGVNAAEQVLRLDSEDSATYILLSNLYAAAERWDYVADIRRKIRGSMLDKDPGLSWIEAKNCVHVFSSGDQLHPDIDEAQAELLRLQGNMQKSAAEGS